MLDMRKLYIIVMAAAALLSVGCEKRFETSIDLGMNTKRINITTEAQEFWVSVFSDGDWIVSDDLQDDAWIVSDTRSGSGNGTVHFVCSENAAMRQSLPPNLPKREADLSLAMRALRRRYARRRQKVRHSMFMPIRN